MKAIICLVFSVILHFLLIYFIPLLPVINKDNPVVVEVISVSRYQEENTGQTEIVPPSLPEPAVVPPVPPPPVEEPVITPEPPVTEPEMPVVETEVPATESEIPVLETVLPLVDPDREPLIEEQVPPASEPDNAVTIATLPAEEETPEPEPEPEPEPRDGRADITTVQTFISDRIQGQIEFKGLGRKLISTPDALDFRLSNNTSIQLSFKIDSFGIPYDIEIPPVPVELERMLTDFVRKMRFSAVLYDEPDFAGMKVELRVR